jgi:mono/diheme cytochrome c family protein
VPNPNAARGRGVYLANCVACHNHDPARDGPIGPAIKGSPKELLEARVLTTSYPPNYRPKRATKIMPQFPFLKDEIPYLAAYLAQ